LFVGENKNKETKNQMNLGNNKMRNVLFAATAVGVLAACSAQAQQSDLIIDFDGSYTGFVYVTLGVSGGVSGNVGLNGEDVYISAFQATYAGGAPLPYPTSNPFNTFCVDILPVLVNANNGISSAWTPESFAVATPSPNSSGQTIPYVAGGLQTAASLYNAYIGNVGGLSGGHFAGGGVINGNFYSGEQWSAALQLAIWQVLYGTSFSDAGVDPTVTSLEGQILAGPYNFPNPNITGTFWDASGPVANQDLIGPELQTGFVPEPGTYGAFAGVGLLVVFLRGQVRRKMA
jgi:hypothetical protein